MSQYSVMKYYKQNIKQTIIYNGSQEAPGWHLIKVSLLFIFCFQLILLPSEIPAHLKHMALILCYLLYLSIAVICSFLGHFSHSLMIAAFSIKKGKCRLDETTNYKNPSYALFLCPVYLCIYELIYIYPNIKTKS